MDNSVCAYHGRTRCMACLALKQAEKRVSSDVDAADGWLDKAVAYEAQEK